jgi:hypothetical protein
MGPALMTKDHADVFAAAKRWAWLLHTAQDFYSHANWVELGYRNPERDLIDLGLGKWRVLPSDWGIVRDDVLGSQESLPKGWNIRYAGSERIPLVNTPNGIFRLLITGTKNAPPWNRCPPHASWAHDDFLNKDNGSRPFHDWARSMAIGQTGHEWCRLMRLSLSELGPAATAVLVGLMVRPGACAHPARSRCREDPPGAFEVTVAASRVRVLRDHEDDGPGQLRLVLAAFSDNLRRSSKSQTGEIAADSGELVAASRLPAPVRLCMNATETPPASSLSAPSSSSA